MSGRLDKLWRVTVRYKTKNGPRQLIKFYEKKSTVDKFVSGTKRLARKSNQEVTIFIRKPLKK